MISIGLKSDKNDKMGLRRHFRDLKVILKLKLLTSILLQINNTFTLEAISNTET